MWNAVTYFATLAQSLKLTKTAYKFCRVTGIEYLEDVLLNQKSNAFVAVDDSDDGATIRQGAGYFNKRSVVVYLLRKYNINDLVDRETKLAEIRSIHAKMLSKIIVDTQTVDGLMYLDKTRIPYHEVPGYFSVGTTGLYFIITITEPISLVYDADDWE